MKTIYTAAKNTTEMGSKTCTYMLRTIRQLQPCNSLAGMIFPKFPKNYRLESTLPLLSYTCPLKATLSSATVPIRCFSHETSPCREANNMTSDCSDGPKSDHHASPLNEHISLKSDKLNSSHKVFKSSTMIALNKCSTPREVLNVFPGPLYRKDELFEGVQKLWHTYFVLNQKRKPIERDFIVDHPHFRHLTHGIWKMAPVFSPGALVRTLDVFVHLKLNQKSKLIQSLLLLCQENLSSLNEEEIVILANTLEYLRSDTNVDMLKSGLRLLMAVKIEVVNEVTPLLTMVKVLGRNAPLKIKLKLEDKALQMVDKFNVAQSESLFCVLADIDFYSEHLLNACSQKLIDGIDELSYTKIISILSCCCELEYSNERLMTVVGDHILKTICLWKPWQLALILQYLTYVRFRHTLLLDRYAAIFTNNLNSVKLWDLLEAVKIYSTLNHLPENNTQQFLEAVNTSLEAYLDSIPPRNLLFTVFNLCILGVYPDGAINKLLEYKNILTHKEHSILAHINMCLMMDGSFSNRQSLLHMKKIPATTCEDIRNFHIEMEKFINDPDLYYHSVKIANTYYINFILALDTQENKLVPVGDMHADNLQITDSSENIVRIAVLCCTPNAFAMGTLHPLGKLALKSRNLKSLGFSVVLVPIQRMMRMTEEKRVEFMKTIIFEELSDDPNALEDRWAKEDLQQSPQDT